MSKIRELWEVLSEQQELIKQGKLKPEQVFKPGWEVLEKELSDGTKVFAGYENRRFGKVRPVVVCRDDGTPIFDQYDIEEGPANQESKRALVSGAVIVPHFFDSRDPYVGLIDRTREVVRNPQTGEQGYGAIELPRGFSRLAEVPEDTATRELGEETASVARKVFKLGGMGYSNANTAFHNGFYWIFGAEVDPAIRSHLRPDARELILKCTFHPYPDVRRMVDRGDIYCNFTNGALMRFDTYLERIKLK